MHRPMVLFRAVLNFMVAGALLGILAVTLMGPKLIIWDNTAGAGDGMCMCGIAAGRAPGNDDEGLARRALEWLPD